MNNSQNPIEQAVVPAQSATLMAWYIVDTDGDAGGFTWFKG